MIISFSHCEIVTPLWLKDSSTATSLVLLLPLNDSISFLKGENLWRTKDKEYRQERPKLLRSLIQSISSQEPQEVVTSETLKSKNDDEAKIG